MKKITLIALLFCSFTLLFAQVPQKMSYQAVIRKTDGSLVVNTSVGIKISILQGSANGTASYVETQTTTTNANGLATLAIGGGTLVTGTFAGINWASGTYFIKTETDPTGGTNYTISGTSQLLSVPYALYSGSSQNKGKTSIIITGNITDTQAAAQIASEVGPYTENIYIRNTTGLTTVDLSAITSLINIGISENTNLTTINLSGLTAIYDSLLIDGNSALSTLSFPVLKTTPPRYNYFSISHNALLTSISFPTLLNSTGTLEIDTNNALTSISFPMLINISGELNIDTNNALTSISFPLLSTANNIFIDRNKLITSINFPNLTSITGEMDIVDCAKLTTIEIPSLQNVSSYFSLSNNALPSSQINTILNKFLTTTPTTGKSISLDRQNPAAPPTGQGIIDKQTLIDSGNSVSTD